MPGEPKTPEPDVPVELVEGAELHPAEPDVLGHSVDPAGTASTGDTPSERIEAALGDVPHTSSAGDPSDEAAAPPPTAGGSCVPPVEIPPVIEVQDFDWQGVRDAVDAPVVRARIRPIVEQMEALLDRAGGPGMLFDRDRADAGDRVIQVSAAADPLWIIGDLHGDLLALEGALALIHDHGRQSGASEPRVVFLGDLFDDEGFGLEILLRVFELIVEAPERVCLIAGNHDEALSYDGVRFASSVSPSDFADFLNANLAHEWIERAGKLAVRLFATAPRALFFPDGLLVAHGGFPLADLHPRLAESGDWNDPACLSDFVWTRAHPKARRKLPNRFSRGSQFGYEDFAAFCALSTKLGRPITRMVRGHDHMEERFAIYPAYRKHPVLTTVALSRRLNRERFGPYERVPTLARVFEGVLPQVFRLHIPAAMVRDVYPEPALEGCSAAGGTEEAEA